MTVSRRYGRVPRVPAAFIMTPAAAQIVTRPPELIVLRAARGFGKTSTIASWLRGHTFAGYDSIWLPLSHPVTPDDLWTAIHDGLSALHGTPSQAHPSLASIRKVLDTRIRRLVLVIDGLHFVGHQDQAAMTAVDDALVGMVHDFPLVHLIAASRDERPIEALGQGSVSSRVLRRPELALGGGEVLALAHELDRKVTPAEAGELSAQLLGWPAVIRAVMLDQRDDGGQSWPEVSVRVGTHFARALFAAPDVAPLLPVTAVIAVAGELSAEEMASFGADAGFTETLPQLVSTGLVEDSGVYRFPAAVRRAVTRLVQEDFPELYERLHALLARLRRADNRFEEALEHAINARDWPMAASIADHHWTRLLNADSPALRRLIEHLPIKLVAKYPTLVMCRDVILAPQLEQRARAAISTGMMDLDGHGPVQPVSFTERLVGLHQINHPGGWHILEWNELPEATQAGIPHHLLQWGISLLGDGQLVQAAYAFALAHARAEQSGNRRAATEAAALIAMAVGRLGHLRTCHLWLQRAQGGEATASPLARTAAAVARRHAHLLRLDPGEPDELPKGERYPDVPAVAVLRELAHLDEAMRLLIAHGRLGLDPEQRISATACELTARAAHSLKLEGLILSGRLDRAEALLGALVDPLPVVRARFAFYIGAPEEALRLLEMENPEALVFPLSALDAWVLQACAAYRADQLDLARDYLGAALALADDTGMRLPFVMVPREDLLAIAHGDPYGEDFLNHPALRSHTSHFIEPLSTVMLSTAERRVLNQLARNVPMAHIGRALFIAESTVKTHVRNIYRKFGVSTRAEALARGRALLLID